MESLNKKSSRYGITADMLSDHSCSDCELSDIENSDILFNTKAPSYLFA